MSYIMLSLPYLRGNHLKRGSDSGACRLNPGLSGERLATVSARQWFSPKMPYTYREADRIVEEMRIFLTCEGMSALHGFDPGAFAEDASYREEMAALEDFANGTENKERLLARASILKKAQLLLLWRWVQEELQEEISHLENKVAGQEATLRHILTPEVLATEADEADMREELPWLPVLRSAAYFFPENAVIFLEGNMAEEIGSELNFKPVGRDSPFFDASAGRLAIRLALGEMPGMAASGRSHSEWLPLANHYWWVIGDER